MTVPRPPAESLETLEPALLWGFFLELSKIPRPSKNEAAAADWVAERGRALGGTVERDAVGNVLIRKAASPGREHRPPIALQCHVDMVCEQNEGTGHDFTRDPLRVRRVGDHLRATGTTLGADNGIGVAAALAVLADDTLQRPAVEVLVTIDEETGLTGAANLAPGWLRAPRLLNLDSEAEGEVTIGCAGGVDTLARRRVTFEAAPADARAFRVKVHGLKGGHSGIDIHAGRANALRLLAAALEPLCRAGGVRLAAVGGGNKRNAIPREAWATVVLDGLAETTLRTRAAEFAAAARAEFAAFDPGIALSVEPTTTPRILARADADAVLGLLLAGPHGVEAMSPAIPGLVQTSTNLGVVELDGEVVTICFLTRSAIETSKAALRDRIEGIATRAGFTCEHTTGYPGWRPDPTSDIVALIAETHRRHFGRDIKVMAIHAGLECGLIGEKYPAMEMASIGPDMGDVHTPDEFVSIGSVQRFWPFLRALLEAM
jgi:dipeptidase D